MQEEYVTDNRWDEHLGRGEVSTEKLSILKEAESLEDSHVIFFAMSS